MSNRRPANRPVNAPMTAPGSMAMPLTVAVCPSTPWMYSGMMVSMPISAAWNNAMMMTAASVSA